MLNVGLFIPCYVDQMYPQVAVATFEILQKFGCQVIYPLNQTCCGQPMANSGFAAFTGKCDKNFVTNFSGFDYIVAPSGSCVLHIKEHLHDDLNNSSAQYIRNTIFEFSEFLTDVLKVDNIPARFPYKVGLHTSCHGQRGLHLSSMSELMSPTFSKPEKLLKMVTDLQLSKPLRSDECCGFGGTFCIFEEAISVKMGKDRIEEHDANHAEYITSCDVSCLMHLDGILKRKKSKVRTIHIAEILNSNL